MTLFYVLIVSTVAIWLYLVIYFSGKKIVYSRYPVLLLTLLFLFIFRTFPFKVLHPEVLIDGGTTPLRVLARLVIYALVAFLLRIWFRGFFDSILFFFKDFPLKLLVTYVLISSSWSITPLTSTLASLTCISISWLAAHVARKFSWAEIYFALKWVLTTIGSLSLIALNLHFGYQGGIAETGKSLAALMSLNITLWLWNALNTKENTIILMSVIICFLSILALLRGGSVAAIFSTFSLVSILIGLRFLRYLNPRIVPTAICLYLIITIVIILAIQYQATTIVAAFGKDPNLTGRTKIWPLVIDMISKKVWIGYGFSGFWQDWRGNSDPSLPLRIAFPNLSNSHNGFLEILLNLGATGLVLYVFSLFKGLTLAFDHFIRDASSEHSAIPILLLLHLVLSNIAECWPLGYIGPHYFWFIFVLVQIRLNADRKDFQLFKLSTNSQNIF